MINLEQTINRNMDIKGAASQGSEGKEKHAIENQTKGYPYYMVAESLDELCLTVIWKAELVSSKLGYLAEISKQSIEVPPTFFLMLIVNHEKIDKLEELLSKNRNHYLMIWESSAYAGCKRC